MSEVTPTLLAGRYEVLAVIGRGGEGTVVRAVDRRHGREVSLKLRRAPSDPRDAERLLTEARTLLSLQPHPGLPLARDDFIEGDRHVLVMDWVEGVDLAAVLAEHGQPGLPPSTVLRWLAPVAEALTHLHTTDPPVVHGDVKPANLVLTPTGRVVLVDFGVSSTRGLRTRGGTPGFRAPEVAAGAVPTRAADVYGLAATAFALLTGEPPAGILPTWEDMDPQRAARLERALRRGLATDPALRTSTPGELVEDLRAGWDSDSLPTGVVTFLATDVVASTRLWHEDPGAAPGLLAEHLLVVDRAVERRGGRRIGDAIQGDATISAFHRAGDAVRAAIDLQTALAGGRVQVHCAAHTGEAVAIDDGFAGAALSRVARVRDLAEAGQVLISETTARVVDGDLPADTRLIDLGPHRLGGFDGPEHVFAVDAPGIVVPPDPALPPYRGLVPYDVDDDASYFGREREVDLCLERLAAGSLLAVVGPSGCGKSSLVRAGIASRLKRSGRSVAVFTPGSDPQAALAAALDSAGPTTVLVIDQLEELLAPGVPPDAAEDVLDAVVARLGTVPVVVALRGDHVGSVTGYPRFARRLEAGLHLITPLTAAELREVIEGPAHAAGLTLELGLVELLLRDVTDEPGSLPLLSFALAETWTNRDGRMLTVEGYLATGGLRRAIATSAERLYEGFPPVQRVLAKDLLLRLVTPAPDGEAVRQRIDPSSVATDEDHRQVVDAFVRARLVVASDTGLEVAHEALVREWPRLRGWLEEDREGLRVLGHLRSSAHEWDRRGQDPAELLRGARLAATLDLVETADPALDDVERRYLDDSRAAEEAELTAARERAKRDARSKRRLRTLLVAAAVLVVGVLIAGVLAVRQRDRADSAGMLAEARRLGTQSLVVDDYDEGLLLAVEGRHLSDTRETRSNLLATIERSPEAIAVIRSQDEGFLDLAVTADGKSLVTSGIGGPGSLSKYDVATRALEASIEGSLRSFSSAVSPDGRLVVIAHATGSSADLTYELHLVDTATFQVVGVLPGLLREPPTHLSFSPDGRYVAGVTDLDLSGAGYIDPYALVWDVTKGGGPVMQYLFSAEPYQRDVAFLPDSQRLLVTGGDGTSIVDIASRSKVGQIDGAYAPTAVSADGLTFAAATDPASAVTIGLFDLQTGEQRRTLAGHRERVVRMAFSPDGTTLASAADDQLVMLWDVAAGRRRALFEGHAAGVNAVAFSPDGNTVWSAGDDGAIFGWDVQREGTLAHLLPAGQRVLSFKSADMVFDPLGRYVVFPQSQDYHFEIRDVATGALSRPSGLEDGGFEAFSPDGTRYVTIDGDGRMRLWDRATGAVLAESAESETVFSDWNEVVAFTPDGRQLVALLGAFRTENSLVVLDAGTLAPVGGEPVPVGESGRKVSVTPDGRSAVVVVSSTKPEHVETKVVVVDLGSRRIVRSTPVPALDAAGDAARNDTVSPDGRTVGLGGHIGDVVVVDAMTGQTSPLLHAHNDFVESVAVAPDKATFVTTGRDGLVELWDMQTDQLLGSLMPLGANHRVRALFVDDHRVLLAYETGEVLEWDPRPDGWEAYACKVAGRNLTQAEWADLFPGRAYRTTCHDYPAGA